MTRHLSLAALLALLSGCATLSPRFDPALANAFAHDDMRKLEGRSVELYYPAKDRDAAVRMLARLDTCLERLGKLPLTQHERPKALIYLTSAEFNNAYVASRVNGREQHMVVPHHLSLDLFNWFELGLTDVGDVSCHEAVHYIQLQQTDGFWEALNLVGGNVYSPNAGLETWFLEGLATYYEGRLGHPAGRTFNPIWRGMFLSGVAARGGQIEPGDLSPQQRDMLPVGGNYLTGMHFVEYLAKRYGEKRLWRLVDEQGHSIFSPFFTSFRFYDVYGAQLGALFDEFRDSLQQEWKGRARPPEQQRVDAGMGYMARLAGSRADGAVASLSAGRDEVVTLKVREADGKVRFERAVTPLLFGRPYITVNPLQVTGMSFSADGQWLYLVTADVADDGADTSRLLRFDARAGGLSQHWELGAAIGGSISPDGGSYVFVELLGGTSRLVRLELSSGRREPLTALTENTLAAPEVSPDGERIVFARRAGETFDLWLRQPDGALVALTRDAAFDYFPHWIDDGRLVFLREVDGRMQVHVMDVQTHAFSRLTNAPFVAFDPVPVRGDKVAFLNREGWAWTLDTVPLPPAPAAAEGPSPSKLTEESEPAPEQVAAAAPAATVLPEGITDTAYSPTDHLFWPSMHVPWVLPSFDFAQDGTLRVGASFGVSLEGSDRLGLHTYAINASYDSFDPAPSVSAAYGNYQLAPWFFQASAGRAVLRNTVELQGALSLSRTFWTTPVSFGIEALQRTESTAGGLLATRLVGPNAAISYFAGDATPDAGVRSGLGANLAATAYPKGLGSDFNMGDVRAELVGFVPLPLLKRHTLRLDARGRYLPGAPDGLLQVGGVRSAFYGRTFPVDSSEGPPDITLPGGVSFVEPLRGYEDHGVRATGAAIAGARYRYPFIIDRGTASLLYLLPSLFIRQVDVEAFAEGAYTNTASPFHRAAGGAVLLRTTLGSALPMTFFYQYAQRFDDGLSGFHYFGMSLE